MLSSSCRPARRVTAALLAVATLAHVGARAADTTPQAQLERFASQAPRPADAARGGAFFASRQGGTWSCASCHGARPTVPGRHAVTGKSIDPLAPAANPTSLTDAAKVDKWFRRNCRDVAARECTAGEKADLIAWLMSLKP